MTLIDEVKRLREENLELKGALVKERVLRIKNSWPEWTDDRKITADAITMLSEELPQINFDDGSHDAAPDLLAVLGGFQPGDSEKIDHAIDWIRQTNANRAISETLARLLVMARKMEASR